MARFNFAGVEDQKDFSPVPAGDYTLELTGWKLGKVKNGDNKGASMYTWEWSVAEDDDNPEETHNRKIFDQMPIMKTTMWRLKAMLSAFGFEVPDDDAAEDVEFEEDELLGRTLRARLSIQPESKSDDGTRTYPAKNRINKFLIPGDDTE
jgi:hypothetical protein